MTERTKIEDRLQGFSGFRLPSYTAIPDQLFDCFLDVLTPGELRVLLYIMRHTFGFKKESDRISARQIAEGIVRRDGRRLDHGTGLSIRQVRSVVASLEAMGLIVVTRTTGEAGTEQNVYGVRMEAIYARDEASPALRAESKPPQGVKPTSLPPLKPTSPPPCSPLHPQESGPRTIYQESLSPPSLLAEAFFATIGEQKPSTKRRERALSIINDLTAEGFPPEAVTEAIHLAATRGARGPELLPFLIGEAHAIVQTRAAEAQQRATVVAMSEKDRLKKEATFKAELTATEALPQHLRDQWEQELRNRLPATISDEMVAKTLPGYLASKMREQASAPPTPQ